MAIAPQKFAKILKIINIIVGLTNITFGVIACFLTFKSITTAKIFLIAAPIWLTLFGLITILVQFNVKLIMKKVNFMSTLVGRGLYNIFLGSVFYSLYSYASNNVVAWISCTVMTVIGIIYICLQCCLKKQYKDAYLSKQTEY